MTSTIRQLTLDIQPHPELAQHPDAIVAGTLKLAGQLNIRQDLNAGDQLAVIVQSADGEILAHHLADVGAVTLTPIHEKNVGVIGTERVHRAKIGDEA